MRTLLLAAVALASGCVAESAGGPAVSHPMANAANATVCAGENPTGSNISRTVCREPPSPEEQAMSTMWRHNLPASPFNGGSHATDTPGLRVYR
jgi:hypothetical protein